MQLLSPSCLLVIVVVLVQVLLEPAALAACGDPGEPSSCGSDTCDYQPDCTCCVAGDFVPDPDDCQVSYMCLGTGPDDYNPLPAYCSGDQVFDPDNQGCVDPDAYECPCSPVQACFYDCDSSSNGFISSHDDCNEYYECDGTDIAGLLHCDNPEAPFFDGATCQAEETSCCRCQPSCEASVVNIVIDPLDCRKFWYCTGSSTPEVTSECPPGQVFNTAIQDCSDTATCVTTCTNVVNTDGCIDPFICPSTGTFAMCPELCVNEYYDCEDLSGEYEEPTACYTGTLFHPDDHICVNKEDCPYPQS